MKSTVVIGSRRIKDENPNSPTFGREGWEYGKVAGTVPHWANAAAKKRCGGDFSQAKPGDIKPVSVYRGIDADRATEIRADVRRKKAGKKIDRDWTRK